MNFNPTILAFFGDIGAGEVLVVLAAILILFGGKGLPQICLLYTSDAADE